MRQSIGAALGSTGHSLAHALQKRYRPAIEESLLRDPLLPPVHARMKSVENAGRQGASGQSKLWKPDGR